MIFSDGHKSGKGQTMEKVEQLEAQIEELNGKLETGANELKAKEAEISELAGKSPDIEKIKADYEQKLIAKDDQYAEKLKQAEERHAALERTIYEKDMGRIQQQLVNMLQGEYHVDAWAAQRAVDKDILGRIDISNPDALKVYQPDGSTPYQPADGQSPLSLLARDVVETIPKNLIQPPKNNGSNYQGKRDDKPSSTTKKRSDFTREERIAFIDEHGLADYEALPN
jgi:hypothetical protein